MPGTQDIIALGLSLLLTVGGFLLRRIFVKRVKAAAALGEAPHRSYLTGKRLFGIINLIGAWWFVAKGFSLVFGAEKKPFAPKLFPDRWDGPFGLSISHTVLVTWGIIAAVLAFALVFRFFIVPRMAENPHGVQLLLETAVENLDRYVGTKLHGMSLSFGAYMFSTATLLVASALAELLGFHAPTADITMTLALALITFFLINYYGFQKKGLLGRIRSLAGIANVKSPPGAPLGERLQARLKNVAQPSTIGFPFRVISDLVVPLSLTCRLFGNMFGGMIIIDLIYYALGSKAIGFPSIAGLYFNVFHPLIQAFIFITLTLSYIEEATAEAEH
jgi:F-type H+-transporting ATPase subunit a